MKPYNFFRSGVSHRLLIALRLKGLACEYLPVDPQDRARVRALAAAIGCDIHPINNRPVLEYLRK
jgi:glutathione S-transferase